MRVRCATAVLVILLCGCSKKPQGSAPWLTAPSRDDHDRFFPIAAGPHAVDCNSCHGASSTFREFDCLGCHTQPATDPLHVGQGGYQWASASCYACHPRGTGTLSPAAHAQFFPIAAGQTHALGAPAVLVAGAIGCSSCHTTADRAQSDCTTCHTQAAMSAAGVHASVPDVPGAACLTCHGDGSVPVSVTFSAKAARHDATFTFRIAPGALHAGQQCLSCHSVTKATAAAPAADFAQQTCTACHAPSGTLAQDCDSIHAGLGAVNGATYANLSSPPQPSDSKSCLQCHAAGNVTGFDHAAWFPTAAGTSHAAAACASCHQDSASRQKVTCSGCHTPSGSNAARPAPIDLVPAHLTQLAGASWKAPAAPTPQCMLCHAQDFLGRVATHGSGAAGEHPGVTFFIDAGGHFADCEKCHTARVTDPALKNPRIDFAQRTCNACHGEAQDKLVTVHGLIGVSIADTTAPNHASACMTCHPDGRAAPSSVPYTHAEFPVGAGSTHAMGSAAVHLAGAIQCASCHTQLSSDPKQIDCTACHTQAQAAPLHASVPDVVWGAPQATSLLCLRCHADGKTPVAVTVSLTAPPHDATYLFRIAPGAIHGGQACLACHSVTQPIGSSGALAADFTKQTCTSCHLLTGTLAQDLAAMHSGVTTPSPGFQPIPSPVTPAYSKTCLVCHASGQIDPTIAAQNHANFFPIAAADPHAYGKAVTVLGAPGSIACAACHVDSASRADVDCTACHVQSGNGAVPADQAFAHAGKVSTNPHNLWLGTGPVASGASARCLSCHAAGGRPAGSIATHGLAGPAATVFGIASGNHFVSCDQCHTASVTNPNRQNPETDFTQASCDACHAPAATLAEHSAFGSPVTGTYAAGDPNNAAACLSCHPNGGSKAGFTHAWFPIGAADKHNASVSKCSDCHANTATYSGPPSGNLASINCTGCHSNALAIHSSPAVGRTIWSVPGGANYTDNSLCLKCHAGNIGGPVASWSTPLVFTLANHDLHCRMSDKYLASGDPTHNVNRDSDITGVNICFACHNATLGTGNTPWAVDWPTGPPPASPQSCAACHEHQPGQNPAPKVTCK